MGGGRLVSKQQSIAARKPRGGLDPGPTTTYVFTTPAYLLLEHMLVHSFSVIFESVPDSVKALYPEVDEKQPR